ncbi:MAG: IS66 family insertion sequence element accessory protein TnpB [Tyzzerella sp.]|nr:IS66 family insertion sequence element accessory protein TnpB [Tyzzerella sp.]
MSIIMECRQSGLSDAAWCEQNGISSSCFYNAVSRLRKKACDIPKPVGKANVLDLTASKQEVVKIEITPDITPTETVPHVETSPMYLDNSHTIELATNGLFIKLNNSVNPILLDRILNSLRAPLC